MKPILFLCAEKAIIDASKNSLSVINIMEDRRFEGFPAVMSELDVIFVARKEDGDPDVIDLDLVFFLDKMNIGTFRINLNFQGSSGARSILQIQGVVIPRPGLFRIVLNRDKRKIASWDAICEGPPTVRTQPAARTTASRSSVARAKAVQPKR